MTKKEILDLWFDRLRIHANDLCSDSGDPLPKDAEMGEILHQVVSILRFVSQGHSFERALDIFNIEE